MGDNIKYNTCSMLWGSEHLYHMHIGGGNKTLLVDMHKRPHVTNPINIAYYMCCLGFVYIKLANVANSTHHMIITFKGLLRGAYFLYRAIFSQKKESKLECWPWPVLTEKYS